MSVKTKNQSPASSRFTFHVSRLTSTIPSLVTRHSSPSSAFTLIEIMVVVAIMAIIMGMSIPFAKQALHREALTQAVLDVQEVCGNARKKAIIQGSMADLVFNAKDATMNVGSAGPPPNPDALSSGGPAPSGMNARFSDQVVISALNINGVDCMQLESARVRFFPNGTCDDMSMVLSRTDGRESTEMILEPTTGMVWIESDRSKFRTKF
jgi:prepilin-type N-terminal cleavage/methylation domain-containing protein